jgi:hypothetical protein
MVRKDSVEDKVSMVAAVAAAVHHRMVRKDSVEDKALMVVRKASVHKAMVLHHGLVHLCRVHIRIHHMPIQR